MPWALTLGALAHLILAMGVGLSVDEAHYALYAYHLDWSYFDHPPLVGWMQWPAVALGGSDLALRIVPLCCAMATAGLLWRITTDWVLRHGSQADAQTAAQGVLWLWLSAPMVHLLTLALVPDSLLMPIALALLLLTLRLAHPRQNPSAGHNTPYPWRDWTALGLCLGLAGLTKYTAVLLVPGVFGLLTFSLGWRWLRGPGPWLAAAIALLLISPVLWWNHQHGWISFAYQWGHAGGREEWQAKRVLGFVLVQVLVFGPLSWWALAAGWRRMTWPSRTAWLALLMALPALVLTLFLSGRGSALPHWTSWPWVLLLPLGAWAWRHAWPTSQRWLLVVVALQSLASAAVCVALLVGRPTNPFADVQGWQSAAERASQVAKAHGLRTLTVVNWSLASRLAWYARPMPVIVAQSHQDQFDLWFGTFKPGDDALWVDWSVKPYPAPLASAGEPGFAHCEKVETHQSQHLGQTVASFALHVCRDWKATP